MARLWNKFLVVRRDGTVPSWPWWVMGGRDPAAPAGLRAYAAEADARGMDREYTNDVRLLADEWDSYRAAHGESDPDASRRRPDDPAVVLRIAAANATVNHRRQAEGGLERRPSDRFASYPDDPAASLGDRLLLALGLPASGAGVSDDELVQAAVLIRGAAHRYPLAVEDYGRVSETLEYFLGVTAEAIERLRSARAVAGVDDEGDEGDEGLVCTQEVIDADCVDDGIGDE